MLPTLIITSPLLPVALSLTGSVISSCVSVSGHVDVKCIRSMSSNPQKRLPRSPGGLDEAGSCWACCSHRGDFGHIWLISSDEQSSH